MSRKKFARFGVAVVLVASMSTAMISALAPEASSAGRIGGTFQCYWNQYHAPNHKPYHVRCEHFTGAYAWTDHGYSPVY